MSGSIVYYDLDLSQTLKITFCRLNQMFVAGNCIDCPSCYGTIFMQQSACQSSTSI